MAVGSQTKRWVEFKGFPPEEMRSIKSQVLSHSEIAMGSSRARRSKVSLIPSPTCGVSGGRSLSALDQSRNVTRARPYSSTPLAVAKASNGCGQLYFLERRTPGSCKADHVPAGSGLSSLSLSVAPIGEQFATVGDEASMDDDQLSTII